MTDLTSDFRRTTPPPRGRGHTVPATGTKSQDAPVLDTATRARTAPTPRQAAYARPGEGGPARRDAPNDFGWHLQRALEIGPYGETMAVTDGSTPIDPAVASVWRVNLTVSRLLSLATPPAVPADELAAGGEARQRVFSLVLILDRAAGAVPIFNSVRWPSGLRPEWPQTASVDVVVLMYVPAIGWLGFESGLGMSLYPL